jgi:hypothetical protein
MRGANSTNPIVKAAVLAVALFLLIYCDKAGRPADEKSALDSAIAVAGERHKAAVEGTEPGLFKYGSKLRYFWDIHRAKRALISPHTTQKEVDEAIEYLEIATTAFQREIIEEGEEVYTGTAIDSIMIKRLTFEHMFVFTLKPDYTYTLFDSVLHFRRHVFLQMGDWQKNDDVCTFTPTLCMTLDLSRLEMVLDDVMAPYSGRIERGIMTIDEFGHLDSVTFSKTN